MQGVPRAPRTVRVHRRPRGVAPVAGRGVAEVGGVRADLVLPSRVYLDINQAESSSPQMRMPKDLESRSSRFSLWTDHTRGPSALLPVDACINLVAFEWYPPVANNQIIPCKLSAVELELQVVICLVGLRSQDEPRADHVQAVHKAVAVPDVVGYGQPPQGRQGLEVPREQPRLTVLFALLCTIGIDFPARWLVDHKPVRKVKQDARCIR
mmetsp:Transcript_35172/g.101010  ORF Transcript_35172/g.101010 Transcript_35172/m.101010 type:complete len:210 (+) Transcript_35172:207-836(+)